MDYMKLANELIDVQELLIQVPARQKLTKMARGELFVLNYLAYHGSNIHPKELSEKMAVSTARIASLLNHLEQKKLIQRQVDPQDNRQIIVLLTQLGRQESYRVRSELLPDIAAMLEKLGPEDAESLIRIEQKIWTGFQSEL